jgi:hypothetical protein
VSKLVLPEAYILSTKIDGMILMEKGSLVSWIRKAALESDGEAAETLTELAKHIEENWAVAA